MSKLILSLEIVWGLFIKCVRASYSSSNTVYCWTRTVLLFVGLHWFSNTIICVPEQSRDHFKNLYSTTCHTREDRAIWYSMWFTEEIRKPFLLNSFMLKVFPKWYDKNLLSFVKCCSLLADFSVILLLWGRVLGNKSFAKYAKSYCFFKPVWCGTVSCVWIFYIWSTNSPSFPATASIVFSFSYQVLSNLVPNRFFYHIYTLHPLWSLMKYGYCVFLTFFGFLLLTFLIIVCVCNHRLFKSLVLQCS